MNHRMNTTSISKSSTALTSPIGRWNFVVYFFSGVPLMVDTAYGCCNQLGSTRPMASFGRQHHQYRADGKPLHRNLTSSNAWNSVSPTPDDCTCSGGIISGFLPTLIITLRLSILFSDDILLTQIMIGSTLMLRHKYYCGAHTADHLSHHQKMNNALKSLHNRNTDQNKQGDKKATLSHQMSFVHVEHVQRTQFVS